MTESGLTEMIVTIKGLTEMIVTLQGLTDSDNERTDRDDGEARLAETQLPITRMTLLLTSKLLEMYTKFCIRIIIFFLCLFYST